MVAFVKLPLIFTLLASRAPKRLPSNVPESRGRGEYSQREHHQQHSSALHKLADEFFPGSLTGQQVFVKSLTTLERHGFDDKNTLVALSVCPDEINHKVGDITDLLHSHFGCEFHLGGLGGIPFTGKTGFSAFSNHVREKDGNCFVLMASHIGLSTAKHLGMYTTDDKKERSACGAAIGALQYCLSEKLTPALDDDADDYQMEYIIQQVKNHQDELEMQESDNAVQATLAHKMWKIGKTKLDHIINTDFGGPRSKLIVLTGVMINMPSPHGDMFQPLTFDLHLKDGTTLNVFEETFGHKNPHISSKLKP